jgi:hypothetical protein
MKIVVPFAPETGLRNRQTRRSVIMVSRMAFPAWAFLMERSTALSNGLSCKERFDDPIVRAANPAIRSAAAGSNRSDNDCADEPQLAKEILAEPSLDRSTGCRSRRD